MGIRPASIWIFILALAVAAGLPRMTAEAGPRLRIERDGERIRIRSLAGGPEGAAPASRPEAGSETRYDLVFFRAAELRHVLDCLEELQAILDPQMAQGLRIVRDRDRIFGIRHVADLTEDAARQLAERFSADMAEAGLKAVGLVAHGGYDQLIEPSTDPSSDQVQQRRNYAQIEKLLGIGGSGQLTVKKTADGRYALVIRPAPAPVPGQGPEVRPSGQEAAQSVVAVSPSDEAGLATPPAASDGPSAGAGMAVAEAPPGERFAPPRSRDLETQVSDYIAELKTSGRLAHDERTSWSVVDLRTGEALVSINAAVPRQTASMVKPLVALAFFHQTAHGELTYSDGVRRHMERMICWSDNISTNWIMGRLGGPEAVERILKANYAHLLQDVEIVDYIPLTAREWQRARQIGLDRVPAGRSYYHNRASALDYSRFLASLWRDELPFAWELRRIMALPNRDRVYNGAKQVPRGTLVYDKTGTTARLCGDMAILEARGADGHRYPYTLIGIIEKEGRAEDYIAWKNARSDVIREVSNLVYLYQKRRYNLI